MKIKELTVTNDEVREAVQNWLATKGITVPITDLTKDYSWMTEWKVILECEERVKPKAVLASTKPTPETSATYVSPVTEALDREAKMHEADATDCPF